MRLSLLVLVLVVQQVNAAAPPTRDLPPGALVRIGYARMVAEYPHQLTGSPDGKWICCNGRWFDRIERQEKPAPVFIPPDHTFHQYLDRGAYIVRSREQHLVFRSDAQTPHARLHGDWIVFARGGTACVRIERPNKGRPRLYLGDLRAGGELRDWKRIATLDKAPFRLHLSDDGGRILWKEDSSNRFGLYEVATGKLTTFTPTTDSQYDHVHFPALSGDGKVAAALCDRTVIFFDGRTGKETRRVQLVRFSGSSESWFTPDNQTLVIPSARLGLMLLPVDAGKAAQHVPIYGGVDQVRHALLADGKHIVTADGNGVLRVHNLRTGKQVDQHSRFPAFEGVQWLDGHSAGCWNRQGVVVTWDTRTGKVLTEARLAPPQAERYNAVRFSGDGQQVAAWEFRRCLLARTNGKTVADLSSDDYEDLQASFHPTGQRASVSRNRVVGNENVDSLDVIDLRDGRRERRVSVKFGEVRYARDGRTYLNASNGAVSLHESPSHRPRWQTPLYASEPRNGPSNSLCLAAFDGTGQQIVIVRVHDAIRLDAVTGRIERSIPLPPIFDGQYALSGSGRWLARKTDTREVSLHDLIDREAHRAALRLSIPGIEITGLALDEEGKRLLTAHGDGTCVVWDLATFRDRARVKDEAARPPADPWQCLADIDPADAQPAIVALLADPARAVALFARELKPIVAVPPKRIAAWIAELDAEDFPRRSAAEQHLADAGDQAEPALQEVVRRGRSLEVVRRAERLLRRIENRENDAERLRQMRAVEILERIASPGAIALLKKLAAGAPAAALTREASASLKRLER